MRKFVIHHIKDTTKVVEIECEEWFVSLFEDRKPHEKEYRIITPSFLFDKDKGTIRCQQTGRIVAKNSIYMWHAIYDSHEIALASAAKQIRSSLERNATKSKLNFNEEEVLKRINAIETVLIGG